MSSSSTRFARSIGATAGATAEAGAAAAASTTAAAATGLSGSAAALRAAILAAQEQLPRVKAVEEGEQSVLAQGRSGGVRSVEVGALQSLAKAEA